MGTIKYNKEAKGNLLCSVQASLTVFVKQAGHFELLLPWSTCIDTSLPLI